MKKRNIIIIVICIGILIAPFLLNRRGEFEGADAKASDLINEINSDYKPWFESIWTPPSAEVESFLFSMQAAIGAGFIGYYIGKKKYDKTDKSICSK
ncbi:MAG: energy-coupling factor ABC transporter substrate-binding protein [Clostridium sp.]